MKPWARRVAGGVENKKMDWLEWCHRSKTWGPIKCGEQGAVKHKTNRKRTKLSHGFKPGLEYGGAWGK